MHTKLKEIVVMKLIKFHLDDFKKIKASGYTEVEEYLRKHKIRYGNVPLLNKHFVGFPFFRGNCLYKTNGKKLEKWIYIPKDLCEKILMFGCMP